MKKIIKYAVIGSVLFCLLFLGISTYKKSEESNKLTYHTEYKTDNSAMLIGGAANNRENIDAFKNELEEENFNKHWNLINKSNEFRKIGDYEKAIEFRIKSMEYAKGLGQKYQGRLGLAKLYEMNSQYDLSIQEYEWCIKNSDRPDVIEKLQAEVDAIKKLQSKSVMQ